MSTFKEANQARIQLKMKLSNYYWYNSIDVLPYKDDYYLCVYVKTINSAVKKAVPNFIFDTAVKIILD